MSQSIFEQIKQSLDEVMSGRRYLIAEIEKLRKTMPDLQPQMNQMNEVLTAMELFGDVAKNTKNQLDGLQTGITSINNMAVSLENQRKDMQEIQNSYLSIKPILEAINKSNQKQEQALGMLNQAIGQLGELMGSILSKMG